MNNNKNLQWGVILSYITMAAGILVSLTYTPFLLQSLGQQQYGLYNMGQAAVSYLGLAEFGFGNAVVRYVAKYKAEGNEWKTAGLYGTFFKLYFVLAAIVFTIGMGICLLSDRFFTVTTGVQGYMELKTIIAIMVVNLTLTFAMTPYSAIINAHERFAFIKITNLLYTILKPLVMIPLLLWGYKAVGLSVITLLLTFLLNLSNVIYVKKALKITVSYKKKDTQPGLLREVMGYSFFIFLGTLTAQLNDNADSLILGSISGEAAVAIYAVGYQLSTYIKQIPGAFSGVLFPRVTAQITKGASMKEMSALMTRIGRLQFYIIFLLCSGFCLFGQEFIYLWAGEGYEITYWIVIALILPASIPGMQSVGVLIVQAVNRHRFRAILYAVCAGLNVLTSVPAGMKYGPLGCAVCTGATTLLTAGIVINWYYANKIHLDIVGFWKSICLLLLRLAPICFVGVILNLLITTQSWLWVFVKIGIYTLCCGLYMLLVCFDAWEKQTVSRLLKHK